MAVRKFNQPAFAVDDAATYKAKIDDSLAALSVRANQFAPHAMNPAGMGITIESGVLYDGTLIAATNVAGIGAPAAGQSRIDRVYFSAKTRTFARVVGVATAGTPVAPALPAFAVAIAQILLHATDTFIPDASIIDERGSLQAGDVPLYDEGNWVPADASGAALVFTGVNGLWTRNGRVISIMGQLQFPVTSNGNNVLIGGLPFPTGTIYGNFTVGFNGAGPVSGISGPGASAIRLINPTGGIDKTNAQMSGQLVIFGGQYFV